jgi:hypothetical protein
LTKKLNALRIYNTTLFFITKVPYKSCPVKPFLPFHAALQKIPPAQSLETEPGKLRRILFSAGVVNADDAIPQKGTARYAIPKSPDAMCRQDGGCRILFIDLCRLKRSWSFPQLRQPHYDRKHDPREIQGERTGCDDSHRELLDFPEREAARADRESHLQPDEDVAVVLRIPVRNGAGESPVGKRQEMTVCVVVM